jgi:hypothetical protein
MRYPIRSPHVAPSSILPLILMVLAVTSIHSQSLTIDISDPAVFAAATKNPNQIEFNGILPHGTPFASFNPLTVSGIQFSTPLANTNVNVTTSTYYSPNNYTADFIVDSVAGTNNISNINNELDITLPQPVHAIGLDYGGLGFSGVGTAVVTLSNGHVFTSNALPTVGQTRFIGFVSTDVITSLKIVTLNDSWVVTDLILATPGVPQGCSILISPNGETLSSSAAIGSFGVITGANCPTPSATTTSPWLSLLPGLFVCPGSATCPASPTNIGSVQFAVSPNPGPPRVGTVSIGNSTFTVSQGTSGSTCRYGVVPDRVVLGPSGGTATVVIIGSPGCQWKAVSSSSWLSVAPSNGSGNGTITLRAPANTGGQRSATVSLASVNVPVIQSAPSSTGPVGGSDACGAVDVTSQFRFSNTGLTPVPFGNWNEYTQTVSITNTSGTAIRLPVFIVLVGEPTHLGYPDDTFLLGNGSVTKCFSAGDYLVLPSPEGSGTGATTMPPGQTASAPLLWYKQSLAGPIRYVPRVISGTPNK